MIHEAQVVKLDQNVEEQVIIRIGSTELTCFAAVCPYEIKEGLSYPVELHPVVFDDYAIVEIDNDPAPSIVQFGTGFAHIVRGRLCGGRLESGGVIFQDAMLRRDFGHLDGKMVSMKVDRIDAEFLPW
jgi:hypothetical protein